jgi:C4-dicarboxylate-specific signal transduction histidine kinase
VIIDISKRRQLEDQLAKKHGELEEVNNNLDLRIDQAVLDSRQKDQIMIQQNRHAIMGEMIGNIAHQWRQPLNALGLSTQRLGAVYGSPGFTQEFLEASVAKSMEIIQHMSHTIDDFRNFFQPDRMKTDFSAVKAVDRALSLLEGSFKQYGITIDFEKSRDVILHGFPNEFAQVLLNIFNNSKDAIIDRKITSPWVKITINSENGIFLVTIADNAGGISESIIDKVFDPYFSTKGSQQGTGIGLFMSKSIIANNMGGRLTVRNTDVGAEFQIEVKNGGN